MRLDAQRLSLILLVCAFVLTCLANPVQAQPKPMGPPDFKLDIEVSGVNQAAIQETDAEVGYSQYRISADFKGFNLGYELRNYRWTNTDELPFAASSEDPFDAMHSVWVGYTYTGRLSGDWGWRLFTRLSSSFEDDVLGLPTVSLGAAFNYMATQDLIIMFGAFGSYNDADQFVLPALGLMYRPAATEGWSGSLAFPISRLNYHFGPSFKVTLRTGWIRRTYKLADDNPVRPEGEFRTSELSAGLSMTWNMTQRWSLTLGGDYLFNREITFFDDGGDNETGFDLDNTWGLFGKISFAF
jgi:hypothetical protein